MSDVVIRAEGLGKKYVIGHEAEGERYTALRDVIARQARRFARSAADMARGRALVVGETREDFWALRDVNFEIRRGEVVGIIGRNGAGKSTLLKILSRITEPTEGRVTIDGRVASLLEVGTGFHPELTGRENIFLNGAILGMTRAEIRRKFDEIVAFAGVGKFIDTPVKRYSSGMKVRLGFSVAAHLEPEILVVDEVLAVGDAEFQKKCLSKMEDVSGQGRTVLFVSHNAGAVRRLCPRAILLNSGKLYQDGETDAILSNYLRTRRPDLADGPSSYLSSRDGNVEIRDIKVVNHEGISPSIFDAAQPICVEFKIFQKVNMNSARITLIVKDSWSEIVFASTDEASRGHHLSEKGIYKISALIPKNTFNSSTYAICLRMSSGSKSGMMTLIDTVQVGEIEVECAFAHGSLRNEGKSWPGPVAPEILWKHESITPQATGKMLNVK